MCRLSSVSCLIILVFLASLSLADIPRLINYQGMLTNDSGEPLDGIFDMFFRIYNAESEGDKRWEENHAAVSVSQGLFNVILGSQSGGIDLDFSEEYWLEVEVENDTMPRLQFVSVGYAYRASVADSAVAATPRSDNDWTISGSDMYSAVSGNVGIGITSPYGKLHVVDSLEEASSAVWARWDGSQSLGAAMIAINKGSEGDAIQAVASGSCRSAIYVSGHPGVDYGIFVYDQGATWAGYFVGDMYVSDNVGIGAESPGQKLDVDFGNVVVQGTGSFDANGEEGIVYLGSTHHYIKGVYGFGVKIGAYAAGDVISIKEISGNVGIGTTSPGAYRLAVNGDAAKTGGGSWDSFSDIRLKKVHAPYEYGLSQIAELNPIHYSYREGNELGLPSDRDHVGLTAQEVQNVIPDAVSENDQGYLMLNSDPIIWAMLNAVKELKAENEELKKRIERLEVE